MDLYRFYCPELAVGEVVLPEDQGHHARDVLRLEAGEAVELFDGKGGHGNGVVTRVGKREVGVMVNGLERERAPARRLVLATAVPKADRADWLIEQASQLGVSGVQWLDCERSVVKPKEGGGKLEKWRRLAVESAKQCGRNFLLEVEGIKSVKEAVGGWKGRVFWLEPREGIAVREAMEKESGDVMAMIGPEGGWSEKECELLAGIKGIVRVKLTRTILRIETACAAMGTVWGCDEDKNAETKHAKP